MMAKYKSHVGSTAQCQDKKVPLALKESNAQKDGRAMDPMALLHSPHLYSPQGISIATEMQIGCHCGVASSKTSSPVLTHSDCKNCVMIQRWCR
jgi:hypothetical protein